MAEIKKCSIISGAPNPDIEFLKDAQGFIICADSGYKAAIQAGLRINAIISDFDSSDKPEIDCEIVSFPIEKDATDTFNAVKYAVEKGFEHITIYNALGGRFDHSYSNLLCLDYCRNNGVYCEIKDRYNRISLITEKRRIKKEYNSFSLFAFLENCYGVEISGAHYTAGFYEKDSIDILLSDQFAQSNFIEGEYCDISLKSGTLLLIESNDL